MGQWQGPDAAQVASFGKDIRALMKWLGMPLGIGLACAVHALGMRGIGVFAALFMGYPTIAILGALWGLRSRSRARTGTLVLGQGSVQCRGDGTPSEVELDRIESFHVSDGGGSSVIVMFRLHDGQSFFAELAAEDAPRIVAVLDERLPSALPGTGLRPMLSRRRRDLSSWRSAMQSLSTEGVYRGGTAPIDGLLSAVRDTRLSAEERIGAALALSGRGSENREQLRIAAQEVKAPALRVAIEHVADETVDDSDIAFAAEEEVTRSRR
jgi:hypothetical protein